MIEKSLASLGLAKKEIQVYLALVKVGLCRASRVAREVDLPRQTVYSLLQQLVREEFVEQSDKRGVKQFFADPEKLLTLLEKRKRKLDDERAVLQREIPNLLSLRKNKDAFPKVQYYEGERGLKRLFRNILDQYAQGEREIFRGYGINTFKDVLHEYPRDFVKERWKYGVETHLFIGRGSDDFGITGPSNAYGRTVKCLDIEPQKAGLYVVGSRVYLFSYADLVGVMVENEAIAKLLRNTFDEHWRVAK